MVQCSSCGYQSDQDAVFCEECGTKIEKPTTKLARQTDDPQRSSHGEKELAPNDLEWVQGLRQLKGVFNMERRWPILLAIDTTMNAPALASTECGINLLKNKLLSSSASRSLVDLAVLAFGGSVDVLHEFTPLTGFSTPHLAPAVGRRCLVMGMQKAIDLTRQRGQRYRAEGIVWIIPNILLLTAGEPDDALIGGAEWEALAEFVQAKAAFFRKRWRKSVTI